MNVKIADLRALSQQLFSHLEGMGIDSVQIQADYYWNIPKEFRYDAYNEPKEFDMGQLSDDWAELQKILENKSEPIGYAFVWLSSILRALGENSVG